MQARGHERTRGRLMEEMVEEECACSSLFEHCHHLQKVTVTIHPDLNLHATVTQDSRQVSIYLCDFLINNAIVHKQNNQASIRTNTSFLPYINPPCYLISSHIWSLSHPISPSNPART